MDRKFSNSAEILSTENALILRAIAAKDILGEAALEEWLAQYDVDHTDTAGFRLLAALHHRYVGSIPNPEMGSRLKGVRRYVWSRNSETQRKTREVFKRALAQQIRPMLHLDWSVNSLFGNGSEIFPMMEINWCVSPADGQKAFTFLEHDGWRMLRGQFEPRLARYLDRLALSHPTKGRMNLWFHPLGIEDSASRAAGSQFHSINATVQGMDINRMSDTELLWGCLATDPATEPHMEAQRLAMSLHIMRSDQARIDPSVFHRFMRTSARAPVVRNRLAWLDKQGLIQGEIGQRLQKVNADNAHRISDANASRLWHRYRLGNQSVDRPCGVADFTAYLLTMAKFAAGIQSPRDIPGKAYRFVGRQFSRIRHASS